MGKGKLILICQSGGQFTTRDDGTLSYLGGEANAVEISCETQFNDLKQKLAHMCDFEIGSLTVKYFLPQNKRTLISLSNDRDLKRMYDFHGASVTADIYVTGQKGFVPVKAQSPEGKSAIKQAETVEATEAHQEDSDVPSTVASPASSSRPRTRAAAASAASGSAEKLKSPPRRKTLKKSVAMEDSEDSNLDDKMDDATPEPIEVDLTATPADTVKKRRRAASLKGSANGSTHDNDDEEEEEREIKVRKKMNIQYLNDSVEGEGGEIHQIQVYSDRPMEDLVASWKDAVTGVGQEFTSVVEFRDALQKYAIANRFGYRLKKNDTNRASGRCVVEGCSWKIHASRVPTTESFTIKKMVPEHSCGGESWKAAHPAKNWLVSVIKERLRDSPSHKPKEIASSIFRDFGLELNYTQVWRGMEDARQQLQGSYKDAYSQLPRFCNIITEANPGSVTKFFSGDDDRFQRLFVAFQASFQGFKNGCRSRSLIFLDSTYLKSKYHEVLFTASALDGDDGVFPVAFAVVDVESDGNWKWFLEELRSAIGDYSEPITFVSDMEKGLKRLVLEVFETGRHGYSIFHLLETFKREMKGPFQGDGRASLPGLLLSAAHAVRTDTFTKLIEQIKRVSSRTHDWVIQTGPDNWATVYFVGERYNYITFNVSEIYSKWVHETRELPILHKVESIVSRLIGLVNTRKEASTHWSFKLTPSYQLKLQELSSRAQRLKVLFSTETLFEVHDDSTHVVDLNRQECTCLVWKATGFPCCHAVAVFNWTNRSLYDYFPKWCTVEVYRDTYSESINPVPIRGGSEVEEQEEARAVLPPATQKPLSFQKQPRKEGKVKLREVTCSRCHGIGHNKATCKEPIEGGQLLLLPLGNDTKEEEIAPLLLLPPPTTDPTDQETTLKGEEDLVGGDPLPLENDPTDQETDLKGEEDLVGGGQLPSENDPMDQETALKREEDLVGGDPFPLENDPSGQETALKGDEDLVGGGQLPSENDPTDQETAHKGEEDLAEGGPLPLENDPTDQETALKGEEDLVGGDPLPLENDPTDQETALKGEEDLAEGGPLPSENHPTGQETALKGGEDLPEAATAPIKQEATLNGEEDLGHLEEIPSGTSRTRPTEQGAALKGEGNLKDGDHLLSETKEMELETTLKGGELPSGDEAMEMETTLQGEGYLDDGGPLEQTEPMEIETTPKGEEELAEGGNQNLNPNSNFSVL